MSGPAASRIAKDPSSSHAARDMAAAEPASHAAPSGPPGNVLALQHAAGNGAVSRLLGPGRAGAAPDGPLLDGGGGQPLDPATRTAMESHLGQDLGQVRIHTGGRAARMASEFTARAFTMGSDVAFGAGEYQPQTPAGQHLLAHELAHTVQQSAAAGGPTQAGASTGALEAEANTVAGGRQITRPTLRTGPRVQRQPAGAGGPAPAPDVQFAMIVSAPPVKAAKAREALEAFRKLSAPDRRKAFEANHSTGGIGNLLRGLSRDDAAGPYKDEVRQLLRWVEEAETQKASGQTDDQMAASQAAFQQAEAAKLAQAKLAAKAPVGVAPAAPTPADKEAARKEQVEQTSIPATVATTWDKMPKATQDAWTKRGEAVVKAVVAYSTAHYPELKITADLFLADFPGVESRGQGVLAFGQASGAKTLAVFGFSFVEAAEANPAYVMSVVVHEVFGHPEYGPYGKEYHLALYDQAQAKIPGYVKPAEGTPDRTSETDAYAYQETEIYSLLRSLPYHTDIAPKDAGKGLVSIDPKSTVEARIALMKQQWKPSLAVAVLRGLYVRLLLDPRITGLALDAFRDGVKANFAPNEVKEILKQGP